MRDLEADLLGAEIDADLGSGAADNLSRLIETKVSIPQDPATTTPPAGVSGPIASQRIEVPVVLEVDGSVEEQEIELLLKIRLKKK